jgi:O-methyltransferase
MREQPAYRRAAGATRLYRDGVLHLVLPGVDGKVLRVAGTGRRLWDLLEYPIAIDALASRLAAEYEGPIDSIASSVGRSIEQLAAQGLVDRCDPPDADGLRRDRYLWLLKRSLVNLIYPEHELRIELLERTAPPADRAEGQRALRDVSRNDPQSLASLIADRQDGRLSPHRGYRFSHSMVGLARLDNVERAAERVFADGVAGDFVEAGAGQGGVAILLRALQVAHGQAARRTWVADSFAGGPRAEAPADTDAGFDFTADHSPWLVWGLSEVRDHFRRYDLLDEGVRFLAGWVSETLATAPIVAIAVLHVDVDAYESTRAVLHHLYDRVSPGGFVIVDEYYAWPPCRQAVDEFRRDRGIVEPLQQVDWSACCWRRVR